MSKIAAEIARSEFEMALDELMIRNRLPKRPERGQVAYLHMPQRLDLRALTQPVDEALAIAVIGIIFNGECWDAVDDQGRKVIVDWWQDWKEWSRW